MTRSCGQPARCHCPISGSTRPETTDNRSELGGSSYELEVALVISHHERPRPPTDAGVRIGAAAFSRQPLFRFGDLPFLLLQILELPRAGAIHAAGLNELHDRVQFAGVEVGAVALADVDDDAGDAAEVDPVHHL